MSPVPTENDIALLDAREAVTDAIGMLDAIEATLDMLIRIRRDLDDVVETLTRGTS